MSNIAVMLRTLEEKQGIGIYARNLMSSILNIDKENFYYFIYVSEQQVGSFGAHKNLKEIVIPCKNKLLWDQAQVPLYARKHIDIIFNTKFSVPLLTTSKTMMVFHGSEWFVYPEFYSKLDILYNRLFLPLYCKKASAISSVSKVAADDMVKFIGFDPQKVFVVHSAIDPRFKPFADKARLSFIKEKYNLPERYILFVGNLYPGKNFRNIVKAFRHIKDEIGFPIKLVSVGSLRWKYEKDFREIDVLELKDDIHFTGWIEQEDLPALYLMADLFLFPSLYEGFGIPIIEAMACGCPVVTANTGACPEVAGYAAKLVDPKDVNDIADGVISILTNNILRKKMIERGLIEAKRFSWDKAARETLKMLQIVYYEEVRN
jgi:glycosyltransferase involved in cell wall biosynthesis